MYTHIHTLQMNAEFRLAQFKSSRTPWSEHWTTQQKALRLARASLASERRKNAANARRRQALQSCDSGTASCRKAPLAARAAACGEAYTDAFLGTDMLRVQQDAVCPSEVVRAWCTLLEKTSDVLLPATGAASAAATALQLAGAVVSALALVLPRCDATAAAALSAVEAVLDSDEPSARSLAGALLGADAQLLLIGDAVCGTDVSCELRDVALRVLMHLGRLAPCDDAKDVFWEHRCDLVRRVMLAAAWRPCTAMAALGEMLPSAHLTAARMTTVSPMLLAALKCTAGGAAVFFPSSSSGTVEQEGERGERGERDDARTADATAAHALAACVQRCAGVEVLHHLVQAGLLHTCIARLRSRFCRPDVAAALLNVLAAFAGFETASADGDDAGDVEPARWVEDHGGHAVMSDILKCASEYAPTVVKAAINLYSFLLRRSWGCSSSVLLRDMRLLRAVALVALNTDGAYGGGGAGGGTGIDPPVPALVLTVEVDVKREAVIAIMAAVASAAAVPSEYDRKRLAYGMVEVGNVAAALAAAADACWLADDHACMHRLLLTLHMLFQITCDAPEKSENGVVQFMVHDGWWALRHVLRRHRGEPQFSDVRDQCYFVLDRYFSASGVALDPSTADDDDDSDDGAMSS